MKLMDPIEKLEKIFEQYRRGIVTLPEAVSAAVRIFAEMQKVD